ncbi:hypothetical protein ACFORJ_00030 [Corynebacterium hansenii]|uniref:Secreted protein n=1 Tax=Corynebacterium hansenii TaxID=394964 RepID=A0ABV7ZMQ1_9CORY|nr:hypothetical protein [Corynebacterium hansenii]WJY99613.1 hypothetical protein CHAN_04955 [Corynebacterium hansenii]
MTHAHTDDKPTSSPRRGLLVGIGIAIAVIVSVAVIASMFVGKSNEGYGAELRPQDLRDSLPEKLAAGWKPDMCFPMMDKPRGPGTPEEDLLAINCLLDDGSPNGVSTTMVSDQKFAESVKNPAEGVDMVDLGSSADGRHELSWFSGTGLIYDVTEQSVLRFGPFKDPDAARTFAVEHELLEAE